MVDVEHRKMRHYVKEHRNGEEGKREKKRSRRSNGDGYKKQQLSSDAVSVANEIETRGKDGFAFFLARYSR